MPYALITGASKGIGKAIAFELAARKFDLILVSRTSSELEKLADELKRRFNVNALYFATDLTQNDSPQKIVDWIKENKIPVSVLVNNAGYGLWGSVDELTLNDQLSMMQINMHSLVKLSYLLFPDRKSTRLNSSHRT